MHKKVIFSLSRMSLALWLISALASTPVMASLVTQARVACGTQGRESTSTSAWCENSGTKTTIGGLGRYSYSIQASAATGYVLGGLRTSGSITFDGLLEGRAGATSDYPVSTNALVQYKDWFRFSFPNAAPGSTLTMKTVMRLHGTNYEYVDESLFHDGNLATMGTELSSVNFGVPDINQMASFLNVADTLVTPIGSTDITSLFTKSLTLDANRTFNSYMTLTLNTWTHLVNGALSSVGVGSGSLGADFSSTAGVVSIEFFDSQNQTVDYQLTTDTGEFAFMSPPSAVPAPAGVWLLLTGLAGLAARRFARRS